MFSRAMVRKQYFIDTGFLIALAAPRDQLHAQAALISQRVRDEEASLITTRAVLLELGAALSGLRHRETAASVLRAMEADLAVEIVALSDELYADALELFAQHQDKEWSLTDCLSFVVMRNRGMTEALSADHHFEQAGFVALLRSAGKVFS
jgi:uncharacterized protein